MERRLSAILAADIVGFSVHAARDELRTIRSLKAHIAVLEPMIGLHSGRIFKTTGDGFLAEFGFVVDAVSCADALQRKMAVRNADEVPQARLVFRMGVHAGDVVIDGDDILGDGVNVAARLEGAADPGGVAVSARVREDVMGKLTLSFTDLGPQEFKNINRPVHVFALARPDAPPPPRPETRPDKPSVAVLPFTNMSPAAEDDYFADGVTEDITTALASVPWLFVIARNSAFTYKGLSVDIRKVGADLGVRYVLEGSVRRAGNRLRVTGQLIDAETGAHIWADRYDGQVEDVFDLQDRISEAVVAAIAPEIRSAEIQRGLRRPPDNLDAYDMFLRGQNALHQGHMEEGNTWLARSIELSPGYAKPIAMRAWLGTLSHHNLGMFAVANACENSLALADQALRLAPEDPEVLANAGYTIGFFKGDPMRGLELLTQSTDKCPSFAWAWTSKSLLSAFAGLPDQAQSFGDTALRLSPRDPFAFRTYMAKALACLLTEDFEGLLTNAEKGIALNPRTSVLLRYKAIALHELGHTEDAGMIRQQTLDMIPGFSTRSFIHGLSYSVGVADTMWSKYERLLLRAGFPE